MSHADELHAVRNPMKRLNCVEALLRLAKDKLSHSIHTTESALLIESCSARYTQHVNYCLSGS